jgi:ATP-dependent DNA helicase RecG
MHLNGSPDPVFETDEDRTWFQVKLPIQPAFSSQAPRLIPNDKMVGEFMLDQLANLVSSLVSDLVSSDSHYKELAKIIMFIGNASQKREDILKNIGLSNQTLNYRTYVEPLEKAGLVEKTIKDKPKSPNQKYALTDRGKSLILGIINS